MLGYLIIFVFILFQEILVVVLGDALLASKYRLNLVQPTKIK